MATERRTNIVLVLACAALAGPACDGNSGSGGPYSEVQVELTSVPTGVACLVLDATPAGATQPIEKDNSVKAGGATSFTMGGLPAGQITFQGWAYAAACPPSATALPAWASRAVTITAAPGTTTSLTLIMQKADQANISVDFGGPTCSTTGWVSCQAADATIQCVNPQSDVQNCGGCGKVCAAGQNCVAGACVTPVNYCSPNPCQNGGTCSNGVGTYTCTCAAGYTGTTCATLINNCSPNPCQNGGTCTNGVNSYTCTCPSGYTGTNCQTPTVNYCAGSPCKHGGTCVNGSTAYSCTCATGFSGANCAVGFQWLPVPSSGYVSGYSFEANAISGDGSTTVGYINQAGGLGSAWKWTESGGLVLLSTSGITVATAVNTNGSVIVGNYGTDPESLAGVSWNASGTETVLSPAGYYSAFGVNGTGDVIVGGAAPAYLPVTWTSGGAAVPLIPGATWGSANCISASGTVIAGYYSPGLFKWVSGAVYSLSSTGSAAVQGISSDGTVIVGQSNALAALWAGGSGNAAAQYLTTPAGSQFSGIANAANQTGSVVVGRNAASGQAFIWTQAAGAQPVPLVVSAAPSTLGAATGISSDGKTVVGYSNADAAGTVKAWIAYLP